MLLDLDIKHPVDETNLYDCRINSLGVLLSYYQFPLSKNEILLLSEGLTFLYCRIDLANIGAANIPVAVASEEHPEDRVFAKLQIAYRTERIDDSAEGWARFKELLGQNTPVLAKMDDRVLKLEQESAHGDMLRLRFLSMPLLIGYSDAEDAVFVYWTNSQSFQFPKDIPLSDFQQYRKTEILPVSPEQSCIYIEDCTPAERNICRKLIHESVRHTAENMLSGGTADSAWLQNVHGHDCMTGISAIEALEQDLTALGRKHLLSHDQSERKKLIFFLLLIRSTLLNGSLSAFREEYGNALYEFGRAEQAEPLCRSAEQLLQAASQWKELLALISKAAHAKHLLRIWFQICTQLSKICKTEKKAFGEIIAYYESL